MRNFYILFFVFIYSFSFSQNSEIKFTGSGTLLPDSYYYCASSLLNLEVEDYASTSVGTSGPAVPASIYNSIYNDATGEQNVPFSVASGITDKFSIPINLGFNFNFFNKNYSRVVVGSNGRLVFTNDPILDNLNDTSTFIDRTLLSPPVLVPSPLYNRIYKTGDVTREIKMAQIFAGFTYLRSNPATTQYKYKKFINVDHDSNPATPALTGILITFQSVIPHNGSFADYGSESYTSRIILLDNGKVILNVRNKLSSAYRAILGMQNEEGNKEIIPGVPSNPNFNNGFWTSFGGDAYEISTGSVRTPTYLWELDRNNDGTIDQISNTRFFANYTPTSNVEKLSVKITFLEPSNPPINSSVIFRKVPTPVIEKTFSGCTAILKVNSASFDSGLTYNWFRDGDPTIITTSVNGELVLNAGSFSGNYYVVPVKPDGTICSASNKISVKKFFPSLIKSQLTLCDNSSAPASSQSINLYTEFYPQYIPGSAFEEYEVDFFENGSLIPNPANYPVVKNKDISITVQKKLKGQPNYCAPSDVVKINYIAVPNTITIPVCFSVTTFNLQSYFAANYPVPSYNYTYTYSDGSSAGNGTAVDVSRIVTVNTTVAGASCSTVSQINFTPGSSISVNPVPVQEKCSGADIPANRFNFNDIKLILDPTNQYDIKFFLPDNTEIIPNTIYSSGANLDSSGYFWTARQGDFIIYAKAFSKADPSCFGISADIILRVNVRPVALSNYADKMTRKACGVSFVNLRINDVFQLVATNNFSQIPIIKYFDASGAELSDPEIDSYPISRGIPYLLIQNGACLPPLKLDFKIISAPFPLANPLPETLCDDSDGNSEGKIKVKIASDFYKGKFTPDYSGAVFTYYEGTILIHTSNSVNDNFEYEISDNKTITVKVSSSNFCENSSTITFNINQPTSLLVTGTVKICYNEDLILTILNASDFSDIKIIDPSNVETNNISGNIIINFNKLQIGKTYIIRAMNFKGCTSEYTFIPSDENQPKIEVINQTNTSIEVIANGGVKPYKYYFNGVQQSSNILQNPTASSYEIQVESATGCFGPPKTVYFIKINNAFTPNADGINDFWKIDNLDKMQQVSIMVLDRNGTKVFESTNPAKSEWDGKQNGRPSPTSTYWYVVSWFDPVTQKNEQRQGWILLKNRN